jgi:predicted TIM-barrel fold metal-dependent hydrolase
VPRAARTQETGHARSDKLKAIDIHTHAEEPCGLHADDGYDDLQTRMAEYFKAPWKHPPTIAETAAHYREQGVGCVIFPVDAERETGYRRLVADFGVQGFKFHPTLQGFYPNDRMAYPLYEAIAETGKPALFHTGQTGVGAGMRGGKCMRLKYSNPMYIDDVAVDFPDMPIILAHPSFPWQEEALSIATHKPNVYIDLSGWSPRYFPKILIQYANTILRKKMLFGSDWPMITPERWLADFDQIDIRPEVKPLVLKENAARLLGLQPASTPALPKA